MSRPRDRDEAFTQYVKTRTATLNRLAFFLCGGDSHRAEDLVQTALTKLYLSWDRIKDPDAKDAYVRQILVRANVDEARRPWRRREQQGGPVGHLDVAEIAAETPVETDSALFDELRRLSTGQRAAVVLRYWHDLSVEETARLMNCSTGTVKTQSSRGLARLRAALEQHAEPVDPRRSR